MEDTKLSLLELILSVPQPLPATEACPVAVLRDSDFVVFELLDELEVGESAP